MDEVACLLELFLQTVDFFLRLDGGFEVVLSEGGDVEQLVFAFEVGQFVLLGAEVGVEEGEATVDVFIGLVDDAFLILDGIFVVDAYGFVDDFGGADGRGVAEGDVDDGVDVVVAAHLHDAAVVLSDGAEVVMCDSDRVVDVVVGEEPCFVDYKAAEGGSGGVLEGDGDGGAFGGVEDDGVLVFRHGVEVEYRLGVVVDEVDGVGRFSVEVFVAVDDAGLGGVGDVEFQVLCHLADGGLGGEDHHLVVDGAIVERAGGEHVTHGGLADGALGVAGGGAFDEYAGRTLVDTVLMADEVAGDEGAEGTTEQQPVEVAQDSEQDILEVDLLFLVLVEE